MAGIGFELRKILAKDTLGSTLKAYSYAGLISAGPFILSIFGILLVGLLTVTLVVPAFLVVQFQVSVTWLIAVSLILTGAVQLAFTRFISDRIFEERFDLVLPCYNTVCLLATLVSGVVGMVLMFTVFREQSIAYRMLMLVGFVVLCNIWIAVIFLTSVKQYGAVLWVFLIGYGVTAIASYALHRFGLEGLLGGFVLGQVLLLLGANTLIWHNYPSSSYLSAAVLQRRSLYSSLVLVGLFFNLGIWIDKFMFWYSSTGQQVIGPLRASLIYDIPIFIAYLSVIPGMAMFLLRIETDFVAHYDSFYNAIRDGGTLQEIEEMRNRMTRSARTGLYEILKVQAIVCLLIVAFGGPLLEAIGISTLYVPLLQIDVVAAALQVLFLGILNIFFYLDRRGLVLALTALFLVLNAGLTWLTLEIGPTAYGFGFAGALLITVVVSIYALDRCFDKLEFRTYMLQKYV